MLGLGLALSVGKKLLGDAIGRLIQKLSIRGTYSENLIDTRNIITDIDDADVLDKATILLTPTATSDALVHCVKDNTSDSDFDFDRASSATRINSSGLVQDMQSITDPELVLNGDFEELGSELVTNGDFANNSDWNVSVGDTVIEDGVAKFPTSTNSFLIQSSVVSASVKSYKLMYNVVSTNGNNFRLAGGNSAFGTITLDSATIGTKTAYITSNGTNTALQFNNNAFIGSIDNVSVQQVDPNDRWTLDTGWSIEDGVASCDGTSGASIYQNISGVQNNIYAIIVTVSNYTSGTLQIGGSSNNLEVNANGTYTHYRTWTSDGNLYFKSKSGDGFTGSIDNVSVKDITFSTDVDLARINYDGNGANGHILLEPTSTNLNKYSNSLTAINGGQVFLNNAISPDGTLNATKVIFGSSTNDGALINVGGSPCVASTVYTFSFYAKSIVGDGRFNLRIDTNSQALLVDENFTATSEWVRYTHTFTSDSSATSFGSNSRYRKVTSNNEILFYGMQLEQLGYATSLIPTLTGSTETRATETLTGSGNSTLINSTEGVLYAEIESFVNDGTNRYITLTNGTSNERVALLLGGNDNQLRAIIFSATQSINISFDTTSISSLQFNKLAVRYKSGEYAFYLNGSSIGTNTNSNIFTSNTLNDLSFNVGGGGLPFYGKCKALAVFNEALSDTELQNLTS